MKKQLLATILSITSLFFGSGINAQNIILSTGFDNYQGTVASVPAGFNISWNCNSTLDTACITNSFYTTNTNFGASAPSYKFGIDGATIVTPMVTSADSITFWGKGQNVSGPSTLIISSSPDNVNWTVVTSLSNLPNNSSTTFSVPLQQFTGYLKFFYDKDFGNLSFDDLKVYSSVVGIAETGTREEIAVYPSPTSGPINIRISSKSTTDPYVEAFDMLGNKVYAAYPERRGKGIYSLDLSDKNKGFYFLKIRTGNQVVSRRVTITN
jgi:hypothetical protein